MAGMAWLAFQQLLFRRRQSILVVGGVMLGTAGYVAFSGIMLGFQSYMIQQLIENDGHMHIRAKEEEIGPASLDDTFYPGGTVISWIKPPSGRRDSARINHPEGWFQTLDADPRVQTWSPQLVVQALAQRGKISTAVRVVGIDAFRHERMTHINAYIDQGVKLSDLGKTGNRALLGRNLLSKIGAAVGETIQISVAGGATAPFRVIGTFALGGHGTDDTMIFASLSDVQKLNRSPSRVSDIAVKLNDVALAGTVAQDLGKLAEDTVESWETANEGILSVFRMQTIIRNLISFCLVLVAGFGIYNILNMLVSQKQKDVGILRSMGFTAQDVGRLFLVQGLVFGVLGGIAGLVAGHLLCRYAGTFQIGGGVIPLRNILISYDWQIYLKGFFLALGSSLFAGWFPARAAGRMNPIDIIRSSAG